MKNTSKLVKWARTVKGKRYDRRYIPLPAQVIKNPKFPFKDNEKFTIDIEGSRLIINKINEPEVKEMTEIAKNEAPNETKQKLEEPTTMIDEQKKKIKPQQTSIIECPACHTRNILMSRQSKERKCTGCGINIKRENFKFINDKPTQRGQQREGSGGAGL